MQGIHTAIRLNPALREEFKDALKANKTTMSKTLRIMVRLFIKDVQFQQRVMNEVDRDES